MTLVNEAPDDGLRDIRVVESEYVTNACKCCRLPRIHVRNSGVRVRRSQDFCIQHARQIYVSGIPGSTAYFVRRVLPHDMLFCALMRFGNLQVQRL